MDQPPTPLGPWPGGINNRLPGHSVPDALLRDALNVDLDNTGRATRRAGLTRIYGGLGCRDVLACAGGLYGVVNGVLGQFTGAPPALAFTPLRPGVGSPWAGHYLDGMLYWTDGVASGRIDGSGRLWPWGVPVPPAPHVTHAGGSLAPGRYLVWLTGRLESGEESGASDPVAVDLSGLSGLMVQTPAVADLAWMAVYLTATNGAQGYLMGLTRPGQPLFITAQPASGKASDRAVFGPPPAGNLVRYHRGRLYVVSGNTVYYSDAYGYGRFRPQSQYLSFSQPVSIFESVTDGIWCVADQTYWLGGGDPKAFAAAAQLDYGAVAGTGCQVPNSNDVMWMSHRGAILGQENGQVKNLQEAQVAVSRGQSGAAVIREQDGLRQFIAAYPPVEPAHLVARDWIDARIIRE